MNDKDGRIRVRHYRNREGQSTPEWYTRGRGFVLEHMEKPITFDKAAPTSRGGITTARVWIAGVGYFGRADCSLADSFCYAMGSTIARGRLRKRLEEAGLSGTVQL